MSQSTMAGRANHPTQTAGDRVATPSHTQHMTDNTNPNPVGTPNPHPTARRLTRQLTGSLTAGATTLLIGTILLPWIYWSGTIIIAALIAAYIGGQGHDKTPPTPPTPPHRPTTAE